MEINKYISDSKKIIDQNIEQYFHSLKKHNSILYDAMKYSVLNGGKRLRPILCIATANCFNTNLAKVMPPALAIEFFHCSTLIHDDLPCMDNDFIRRGQPTCHIKFGEANAILAGDALIIESFKILGEYENEILTEFSNSVGAEGVIAGQVSDLYAEEQAPSKEKGPNRWRSGFRLQGKRSLRRHEQGWILRSLAGFDRSDGNGLVRIFRPLSQWFFLLDQPGRQEGFHRRDGDRRKGAGKERPPFPARGKALPDHARFLQVQGPGRKGTA